MSQNYFIPEKSILSELFSDISRVGYRDQAAALQMLLNFSAALNLAKKPNQVTVLETGSGFSTRIFEFLLQLFPESTVTSVDLAGELAATENSRNTNWENLNNEVLVRIIQAPSVDLQELEAAWGVNGSLSWDPSVLDETLLAPFVDFRLDNRKAAIFEQLTGTTVSPSAVLEEISKLGKLDKTLFSSRRYVGDEFAALGNLDSAGCLESLMHELSPDVIFLDSGEFSTLAEFLIVDRLAKVDSLLVVQDILFPKSIKSFIIGALCMGSDRWQMLWVDKTTPQGIFVARRIR